MPTTPNAIWAIVIGAAIWIIQTYFPGMEWAGPVVAMLIAVAKLIQVNLPESVRPMSDFGGPAPSGESKLKRWLVG